MSSGPAKERVESAPNIDPQRLYNSGAGNVVEAVFLRAPINRLVIDANEHLAPKVLAERQAVRKKNPVTIDEIVEIRETGDKKKPVAKQVIIWRSPFLRRRLFIVAAGIGGVTTAAGIGLAAICGILLPKDATEPPPSPTSFPLNPTDAPLPTKAPTPKAIFELVPDFRTANQKQAKVTLEAIRAKIARVPEKIQVQFPGESGRIAVVKDIVFMHTTDGKLTHAWDLDKILNLDNHEDANIYAALMTGRSNKNIEITVVGDNILYTQRYADGDSKIIAVVDSKTAKQVAYSTRGNMMATPLSTDTSGNISIGNEMATESVRIFNPKTGEQASYLITSDASLGMNGIREFALPVNMNMADLQNNPAVVRNLVTSQNQASALITSELVGKQKLDSAKLAIVSFAEKENSGKVVSIVKSTTDKETVWLVSADGKSLSVVKLPPNTEPSFDFGKNKLTADYNGQKVWYDQTSGVWQTAEGKIVWPLKEITIMTSLGEVNLTKQLNPQTTENIARQIYGDNFLGPKGAALLSKNSDAQRAIDQNSKNLPSSGGVPFNALGIDAVNVVRIVKVNNNIGAFKANDGTIIRFINMEVTDGVITNTVQLHLNGNGVWLKLNLPTKDQSNRVLYTVLREDPNNDNSEPVHEIPAELIQNLPPGTVIGIRGDSALQNFKAGKVRGYQEGLFLFVNDFK